MYNLSEKIVQYLKKYKDKGVIVPASLVEEEEKQKTVDEAEIKREELKKQLKTLNDELQGKKGVELSEMEYTPLSKEQIEDKAKEGVEEKYELKKNKLDGELTKSISDLTSNSDELVVQSKTAKKTLEDMYKEAENAVGENAIKRGISRSSIVAEQLKDLSVEKIKDTLSIDGNLASELKKNSDKIESLKADYRTAINELDLQKAIEITENVNELTKAQEEKIDEVLKYNNTVKRQQAELDSKIEPPSEVEASKIKGQIIKQAVEYYSELPKNERLTAFDNDDEILKLLGSQAGSVRNYIKALP